MSFKLIKCPYCGYKYRTDIKEIIKDGETIAVRPIGRFDMEKAPALKKLQKIDIDLECPSCGKLFAWEVEV